MKNKQSGFTLVEIMIVVAIIALLAAIAVPNFLRARQRSLATSVKNDIRIIESAADQYAIESGLSGTANILWTSITGYFKTGSKIASGQSAISGMDFSAQYSSIPVGSKLSATTAIRAEFADTSIIPVSFWND
ncbi:MAG: prepilin-type N-terminal cleavage/methylation domain-containing protein [Verrucomicrobiota bacterium]|nr:prepilin-type N-terminal cleavage/methylation domain-containing protein [Verrucomicrobiota bacterium]